MDDDPLWLLPALWLLIAAQNLTQFRGRVTLAFAGLFALLTSYFVITFSMSGSRPSVGLVIVTGFAVLYLAGAAVRLRVAGLDVFRTQGLGPGRSIRGAWTVARVRRRLDQALRRGPEGPAATVGASDLGDVLVAAAREAGGGDVLAAARRLDAALAPPDKPSSSPDARLGIMLYHRTVYSALATVTGDSPAELARWHDDVALARTVLPDVRFGWLADAAVAVAEGRRWPAVYATDALLADVRGPWEKGLGAAVGRLARDVPDEYRERRHAYLIGRNPWVAGLADRLRPVASVTHP